MILQPPLTLRPQRQLIMSKDGDCYRTCIAILLGLEAQDVPHFCGDFGQDDPTDGWVNRAKNWLAERGLALFQVGYSKKTDHKAAIKSISSGADGIPIIMIGTVFESHSHAVVLLDGALFCDPSGLDLLPERSRTMENGVVVESGCYFHIITPIWKVSA